MKSLKTSTTTVKKSDGSPSEAELRRAAHERVWGPVEPGTFVPVDFVPVDPAESPENDKAP